MRTEWFGIEYWFAVFMMIRASGILFHFGKSENEEEKNIAIEIKKIFSHSNYVWMMQKWTGLHDKNS